MSSLFGLEESGGLGEPNRSGKVARPGSRGARPASSHVDSPGLLPLGMLVFLLCGASLSAHAKSSFFLPLRFEAAGTCIGNGSTLQTVEVSYGSIAATLPFAGTTTYDFYSPPITAAPALAASTDGAGGQLWLTNGNAATDFNVKLRFAFYDYNPNSGLDILIVDTADGASTTILHRQAAQVAAPNVDLPGNFTAAAGHLLHIRATVTLVSGTVTSGGILFNGGDGAVGDSGGMLPQKHRNKSWTFGGLAASPDATITPSSPAVPANSTGNTASVPSTTGATYAWTISGGAITGGQGTRQITWTAGATGPVGLGVTVTRGCSSTGSASVQVDVPKSQTPFTLAINENADRTVTLTIQGDPTTQYLLQATTDLSLPAWTIISTNTTGANGLAAFRDVDATNYPARFYRALIP